MSQTVDARALGLPVKAARILEATPFDTYVSSADISDSTGISSREIGATIQADLYQKYITRKKGASGWLWRRKR